MSRKFAVGVTLTDEEKARIGFRSQSSRNPASETGETSRTSVTRLWSGEVSLPDGTVCSVSYIRDGPRCHRFEYKAPIRERVWVQERLDGGVYAVEQKAQELAVKAFAQAQAKEQQEMRRATCPSGRKAPDLPLGTLPLRVKNAKEYGGCYAVCVRFPSGNLVTVGALHEHAEGAVAEYERGQHGEKAQSGGQTYVIGICCRWQRRWIEPQFLARRLPTQEQASEVIAASAAEVERNEENKEGEEAAEGENEEEEAAVE